MLLLPDRALWQDDASSLTLNLRVSKIASSLNCWPLASSAAVDCVHGVLQALVVHAP